MTAALAATAACGSAAPGSGNATDAATEGTDASSETSATQATGTQGQPAETETETESGSSSSSSTGASSTGPMPECVGDSDCGAGERCGDGECYCPDDYGCFEDECETDENCAPGELCLEGDKMTYCTRLDGVPECGGALSLTPVMIPAPDGEAIISLTFVASETGSEENLVIGTMESAHVASSADGAATQRVTPAGQVVRTFGAVGADLFADGGIDLGLLGSEGVFGTNLSLWRADGAGAYLPESTTNGMDGDPLYAYSVRNGDGTIDAVVATQDDAERHVYRLSNGASPLDTVASIADARAVLVADVDGDDVDDLAIEGESAQVRLEVAGVESYPFAFESPGRRLAAGRGFGAPADDLVAVYPVAGWFAVEQVRPDRRIEYSIVGAPLMAQGSRAAVGAVDDDALTDLVLLSGDQLLVAFGEENMPRCWSAATLSGPMTLMSVGDYTGDGRSEIAVSDGTSVEVLSLDES